jgi:hypothetical protein
LTDYVAIMLNGVFTGIGVILAHELYDSFKKYRDKVRTHAKKIIENGYRSTGGLIEELMKK